MNREANLTNLLTQIYILDGSSDPSFFGINNQYGIVYER